MVIFSYSMSSIAMLMNLSIPEYKAKRDPYVISYQLGNPGFYLVSLKISFKKPNFSKKEDSNHFT